MFDNEFYNQIKSELTNIKELELHNASTNCVNYNLPLSWAEFDKVCNGLNLRKSTGPDMIPNEVLKQNGLRALLLPFLNKCFMKNIIPTIWRNAIIVPIPKSASKDPYVPLNYRGISLLSCVYKLFTSLLNLRISDHCEAYDYLVDEQNGFRPKRSCQDHIHSISTIIRNRKTIGLNTFCAFVDFQKAFDRVNRELLMYNLATVFRIHGRLFNMISTIYDSSNAQLRLNGLLTESFFVSSGVKQGDVMSPTLFSMYINDLATGIKDLNCGVTIDDMNVSILLYADDIVLIAPEEESRQKMLDFVAEWCRKWRMYVNSDKTQVVHFRQHCVEQSQYIFKLGSDVLKTVQNYKYLGVVLDEHMDFELNASILAEAAGRALGAIRSKLKYLKECGYKSFNTLFKAGVLTIADYSAGVWGTKSFPKSEQVQYKAARYFLGVHRFAPIEALLGDMGWTTAKTRHKVLILKWWNKLCCLPRDRLVRKLFDWDCSFFSNKKGTWSYCAKHVLSDIGCDDNFQNIVPCDMEYATVILAEMDTMDWDIKRYKSEKLRYYNLYKYDNTPAEYVMVNISKYQRSLFAQFRSGILPLEIEIGRYRNIPLELRVCKMCHLGVVEDEIHFLCECPRYSEYREILFHKARNSYSVFENFDNLDKFVYIMSNLQRTAIQFVSKAIPVRQYYMSKTKWLE